jgi:hypothetical protein
MKKFVSLYYVMELPYQTGVEVSTLVFIQRCSIIDIPQASCASVSNSKCSILVITICQIDVCVECGILGVGCNNVSKIEN